MPDQTPSPAPPSWPAPRLGHLEPAAAARVELTLACRDADELPRVPEAGALVRRDGVDLQVMHNGVVVEEGCYYGPWMTEIIRGLGGVHEPQEEIVFAAIMDRLRATEPDTTMVELGSFWAYYSLWFLDLLPDARVVAMEPDPAYLETGRRNVAHNGRTATFVHGAVGAEPGRPTSFVAESTGETIDVVQHDLASLLIQTGVDRVGVLMVDIQGFETVLLERARDLLAAGRVRFLVVSTHHHLISGDPLTHQRVRDLLRELGAHTIAEHSVSESFSGDGLVAVSFDARDHDLVVPVSRARAVDSLFGELERDLDGAYREVERLRTEAALVPTLHVELAAARTRARKQRQAREATARQLADLRSSRAVRWSRSARGVYNRIRPRG